MSLTNMKELLNRAEREQIAVGAFNAGNMEMLLGILLTAEKLKTPVIIQIAESRLRHSPLHLMAPMMVEAAKKASVPVAVHFDHGKTEEAIAGALNYGFTSVMFDGSGLNLEENIEKTNKIAEAARKKGASVEAELGILGGSEGDRDSKRIIYTRPEDARLFSLETDIDALAVAIGNAHGNYKEAPNLRFDILEEINRVVKQPLVLHGGTGISPADFQKCISLGIRKINIATANFDACTEGAHSVFMNNEPWNYFSMNEAMVCEVSKNVEKHIKIFNMETLSSEE